MPTDQEERPLYDLIQKAATSAVAIRAVNKLLPAEGGEHGPGKVMPPTFSDRQYAWEDRERAVITLDTVASHANRQEVLLGQAATTLKLPVIRLRFPDQQITTFQASHRAYDALFRDAILRVTDEASGEERAWPFRGPLRAPAPSDPPPPAPDDQAGKTTTKATPQPAKGGKSAGRQAAARGNTLAAVEASPEGTDLERATLDYATPLYQLAPHCLIYGCWDSTGAAGGLGAKFARAVESRVTGHGARLLLGTRGKLDVARLASLPTYHDRTTLSWTTNPADAFEREGEPLPFPHGDRLSEVNHSSVTPDIKDKDSKQPLAGGVTIEYAVQRWVLSLPVLRTLCFPARKGETATEERDRAGRTVLALLALCGLSRLWDKGMWFRSGCTLDFTQEPQIEVVHGRGKTPDRFTATTEQIERAYLKAVTVAEGHGLKMRAGPIDLEPGANLLEAYQRSRVGGLPDGADADAGD